MHTETKELGVKERCCYGFLTQEPAHTKALVWSSVPSSWFHPEHEQHAIDTGCEYAINVEL